MLDHPMMERIVDPNRFQALRAEWDELLNASSSDSPFLTWEWLWSWWKHLAEDRKLHIVALRDRDRLVAIAPLVSRTRHIAGLASVRLLEFLGTGSVGSDYLDLIVRRGEEAEVLGAFADYLAKDGIALEMAQVDAKGSVAHALASELTQRGWNILATKTHVCPFIDLSGHTWSSYLATLGSAHRQNFQRRLRNATKQLDLRFAQARSEEERRAALASLVSLHQRCWQGRGGSDGLHTPALLAFHEEVSQLALERGWLRLFVLSLEGRPAAALYGFRYGRAFYFYQSGFDPTYGKYSVGLITMGLAIQHALEEGATEYDLLHGDEAYKFHWARVTRELCRLEVYPPHLRGLLYRRTRQASRALKRTVRRYLPISAADRISAARRLGVWRGLHAAWRP
jgi:CelD/BcsL family acetyltransferase involved in cellulose biosynthesis